MIKTERKHVLSNKDHSSAVQPQSTESLQPLCAGLPHSSVGCGNSQDSVTQSSRRQLEPVAWHIHWCTACCTPYHISRYTVTASSSGTVSEHILVADSSLQQHTTKFSIAGNQNCLKWIKHKKAPKTVCNVSILKLTRNDCSRPIQRGHNPLFKCVSQWQKQIKVGQKAKTAAAASHLPFCQIWTF